MQELNEQELEHVNGGAWSFPTSGGSGSPNSSSAGTSTTATATGQNFASIGATSQSYTISGPPGFPSASFSIGGAYGYSY
jgi:bacteriocin-like protein